MTVAAIIVCIVIVAFAALTLVAIVGHALCGRGIFNDRRDGLEI